MRTSQIATYLLWFYAALSAFVALRFFFGLPNQAVFTPILTLLASSFALLHGSQKMGWKKILILLGLTIGVSLLFESVGVATGLVYGKYHYSDKLGIKFLGLVPFIIPAAWFMMMYPAYVIASRLIPSDWTPRRWRLGVAALGGIIMTAWDLAMDPLMVSGGHWIWDEKGAYFGVPLQNYWGWWLTTFVTFAIFVWLAGIQPKRGSLAKDSLDWQAIVSYSITGLSTIFISMNLGLGGSGLVGLFAMLPWALGGWLLIMPTLARS
jgi:uncharacterized membrane protein